MVMIMMVMVSGWTIKRKLGWDEADSYPFEQHLK